MASTISDRDGDLDAVTLREFIAARPSEDGSDVQLLVKLDNDTKVLSIPREQILTLTFTLIRMEEECRRILNPEDVSSPATMVVATGTGVSERGDAALTLISDQGLKLSFAFTPDRLSNLLETIRSLQALTTRRSDEQLN